MVPPASCANSRGRGQTLSPLKNHRNYQIAKGLRGHVSQYCPKLKFYRIVQFGQMSVLCSDVVLTLFLVPPHAHVYVHYNLQGNAMIFLLGDS